MKKRLLSMILALSMLLTFLPAGALPAFAASDPTASDGTYSYSYTENADGTLTITAFLGTAEQLAANDYTVTIPTELDGKQVTAIGQCAFGNLYGYSKDGETVLITNRDNNCTIQKVIIPDSIISIGDYAFFQSFALSEVSIPDSEASRLNEIGREAFAYCKVLKSFDFPKNLISIGYAAFGHCSVLDKIVLPGSIKNISDYAFTECHGLKEATLSSGITSVGNDMFYGCYYLTTVSLPDTLTSIGEYAFRDCHSLNNVVIPDHVTDIGKGAFYECVALSDLSLGNALTSIGDYAFYQCEKLTSIILPESFISIGENAFSRCEKLVSVTILGSITTLPKGVFSQCFRNELTRGFLTLPASLTSIEKGALDRSYIGKQWYGPIYYNGSKTDAETLVANSNNELDNRILLYRCNVNFRTQDGDLIKTVPVYSTMDVKQDDIPVDASGTTSTWYLDKEMTQSFDPANTNGQITDDLDLYTAWNASAKTGTLTVTNGSFTYEKQDGEEVTGKTGEIPVGTLVTVSFDKDAFADSGLTFDHWDIKGLKDPTAYNKMEKFTFEMPESAVTMEGMSRDSSIDDGPDLLGTAAIIGTAVVGTAILAYQGHQLGTELYLTYLLPSGAVIPQNRIQLAMLLWQDAGNPAPAAEPAYSDIDADDTDAQNAAQWAVENELMELPDADNAPDQFDPYAAVSTVDVIHAWKKAQKVKG